MQIPPESDLQDTSLPSADEGFRLGPGILRAISTKAHERRPGEPLYRRLRIYTRDPAESILRGAVATVNVPYEPLEEGPVGRVLEIDSYDSTVGASYRRVDLSDPLLLLTEGYDPSPGNPGFQQQMVYAVASIVYETFRRALGRDPSWGFDPREPGTPTRLRLFPHAKKESNAYYDKGTGAINFGYYEAVDDPLGRNLPNGVVFTSLSHDVIVHEVTHAILDGLRPSFNQPSTGDVAGFHEGFADLTAIFQHFSHRKVLEKALSKGRGQLTAEILVDLARQFGQTTRAGQTDSALRSAISEEIKFYKPGMNSYQLGSLLTSAVFEAFQTVYWRKTRRYRDLALPPGTRPEDQILSPSLVRILAEQAQKIAGHFQSICIRAVDYCPPVDLRLGEYLRAMITADFDLVPSDPWAYREALVDAFRKRKIDPHGVRNLSEDALLWKRPSRTVGPIEELAFANLRFDGDPGRPMGAEELKRQARILGRFVTRPENLETFGLVPPEGTVDIDAPCIESIRTSRRVSPDGDIGFDLVAEVTQKRLVSRDGERLLFYGGSTIILGPRGEVRYSITKSVDSERRLGDQLTFVRSSQGRKLWEASRGMLRPKKDFFRLLH